MNRLSWYSEWIDHLLCGVRYRTVMPSSPCSPTFGSPNRRVHVQRRPVDRQPLAEFGDPVVVEEEVLPAGQRVPRLEPLHVDGERRVPAPAGLRAGPLRRGDHRGRPRLGVGEGDLLALVLGREVGELHPGPRLRGCGSPGWPGGRWWCRTAPGSPRTPARRGRSTAGRRRPRRARRRSCAAGTPAPCRRRKVTPLVVAPSVSSSGPSAAIFVGDRAVVPLDDDQLRHRHAGDRLALAGLPVADPPVRVGHARPGCRAAAARPPRRVRTPRWVRGEAAERRGDRHERVPVGAGLPRRGDRRVERVARTGACRWCSGRASRTRSRPAARRRRRSSWRSSGSPASAADRACRPAPRRATRRRVGRASGGASVARTAWSVPSRCRRKYSLPLAEEPSRFARQIGQHPGEVLRRVRVLAGEPQSAALELVDDVVGDRLRRRRRPRRRGRAGCGRTCGYDGIQPIRADAAIRSAVVCPANAPPADAAARVSALNGS